MRQRTTVQILQFINMRLSVPKCEVAEEFSALIVPKSGDNSNGNDSIIPEDPLEQLRKPVGLAPYETGRSINATFREARFRQALIDWRKECNATSAANAKSSAYQELTRTSIDGFKRQGLRRSESMNGSGFSNAAKPSPAKVAWLSSVRKVQTRNFVQKVKERLVHSAVPGVNPVLPGAAARATISHSGTSDAPGGQSAAVIAAQDKLNNERTDADDNILEEEDFYAKLSRFQSELPALRQSADHAAYLEQLAASVIGLFKSNLAQVQRSHSYMKDRYSAPRQRWVKAARKVMARNHTAALRAQLERSPSGRSLLLDSEGKQKVLEKKKARAAAAVPVVTMGDAALMERVSQLLGADWLSSEEGFYALLNRANEEIAHLAEESRHAALLASLTAAVVCQFRRHLERIKKSNSYLQRCSEAKRLWLRAIDRVMTRNYTDKMKTRLERSPTGRGLLGAKERKKEKEREKSALLRTPPRRHTRRDDIQLLDLPKGYSEGARTLGTSSSAVPVRGLEKAVSADEYSGFAAGRSSNKGTKKPLPSRLQRQEGLKGTLASGNNSSSQQQDRRAPSLLEHSKSLRTPTATSSSHSHPHGHLAKSVSTSATLGAWSSADAADECTATTPPTGKKTSLLKRLVGTDPFARSKSMNSKGNAKLSGSGASTPSTPASSLPSSRDVGIAVEAACTGGGRVVPLPHLSSSSHDHACTDRDTNSRDSFDSAVHFGLGSSSNGGSVDEGDGTSSGVAKAVQGSPSLYQRLMAGSGSRSRTNSDSDSATADGDTAPHALKVTTKSRPHSKQSSRIVPINIAGEGLIGEDDGTATPPEFVFRNGAYHRRPSTANNNTNSSSSSSSKSSKMSALTATEHTFHLDSGGAPLRVATSDSGDAYDSVPCRPSLGGKNAPLSPQQDQQSAPAHKIKETNTAGTQQDRSTSTKSGKSNISSNSTRHKTRRSFEGADSPYAVSDLALTPVDGPTSNGLTADSSAAMFHGKAGYFSHPGSPERQLSQQLYQQQQLSQQSLPQQPQRSPSQAAISPSSAASLSPNGIGTGNKLRPLPNSPGGMARSASSVLHQRFDTVGDISRRYNIDASAINSRCCSPAVDGTGAASTAAVPRYAQNTIKSLIRGHGNSNLNSST